MKAFVLESPGHAIIKETTRPKLKSEYGAVLRPIAMSVCTSDVNTVYGSGSRKPDNLILGHECIARITEVGNEVRDFKPGETVAVPAITPDWRQREIQEGNICHAGKPFSGNALGRSMQGVFAEYFYISDADTTLAHIPEDVSVKDALMCVDVVTTGFTGAEEAEIKTGDTVVVIGIGAIGLMAVAGAVHMGAARIIAVGSRPICRNMALSFGANEVISYKEGQLVQQILEKTNKTGADAVIICGGDDSVFSQAVDMVRYGIGRVVNLKLFTGDGNMMIPKFSSGRGMGGKTIKMELCRGGRVRIERMLKMVSYGRITPGMLVTHELDGFNELPKALEMMRNKQDDLIKIMVTPEWK